MGFPLPTGQTRCPGCGGPTERIGQTNFYRCINHHAMKLEDIKKLPEKWESEAAQYPNTYLGAHAAAAVHLCAKELREALGVK